MSDTSGKDPEPSAERPARLGPIEESALTDAQRAVRDAILSGPRKNLVGPFPFWLRQPGFAGAAQELGRYVRWESSLSPSLRELAILVTGRVWRSTFEWQAHKQIALDAGLNPEIIESIRRRETPRFETEEQAVVYDLSQALLVDRAVTQALYDRAVAAIGVEGAIDVIATTGYYTMVSMTLNMFDVPGVTVDAGDFE